jgi:hypothetical protein
MSTQTHNQQAKLFDMIQVKMTNNNPLGPMPRLRLVPETYFLHYKIPLPYSNVNNYSLRFPNIPTSNNLHL